MYAAAVRFLIASTFCCALTSAAFAGPGDDQFAVAAGHYSTQRWQLAVDEFRAFLREYPEHAKRTKAQFFQAEALVQLGKHGDAYPLYVEVLADDPSGAYAKQALFRAAEAAFLSDRGDEAQVRMKQFVSKYPNEKLIAYLATYQADLTMRSGDEASAERQYRETLARFPDMPTADECRFALAKLLEDQKKTADAATLWREIAQGSRRPWNEMALLKLASGEIEKKDFKAALAHCDALETRFPASEFLPQARLVRGRALYELGRLADARTALSPLTKNSELAEDARYWLGLTLAAEKKFNEAAEALKAASEAEKKKAEAQLAKAKQPPAEPPKSEPPKKQPVAAAEKSPEDKAIASAELQRRRAAAMRYRAAEALIRAGEFNRAIDTLKAGDNAGDDPTTLSTQYLLAVALQGVKNNDEAIATLQSLQTAIERALRGPGPNAISINADKLRRFDAAQQDSQNSAVANRNDAATQSLTTHLTDEDRAALFNLRDNARLALATSLIAIEKFAEAVEPLQAYLASDEQDVGMERARSALAICLARTKRVDAAKLMLEELKSEHPDSKLLLTTTHHVAEAAYAEGQYQTAYLLFSDLAAERNPPDLIAKGLAGMGWSRQQLGELETAAEIFGEFLQMFPADSRAVDVTLARAQALERLGKTDAALIVYKQAIGRYRQSPQLPQIVMAAARLHDQVGQDEEAISLYQRIVREFPKTSDVDAALYGWAWALRDLGRGNESDKVFTQLHKQYPSSRFWADTSFRLAERAAQRGDRKQATALIQPLFESQCPPAVIEHALYLQAQIAIAEQQWKAAETPLKRLLEEHPNSTLRLPAEFWYAESAYRAGDHQTAKQRFDTLAQNLGKETDSWVAIVPLRRAQLLAQDKQWRQAQKLAESIARDFPEFDQQYEADYLIGRSLAAAAEFDEARKMYHQVVRSPAGGKTETAAMAQWMIGESYFHQENYESALREYLRVEILYPYPRWQAAALLQAGKCHEELGRFKEAIELYAHLLKKHPDSEFVEEASKRIKDIETRPAKPLPSTETAGELRSVLIKK